MAKKPAEPKEPNAWDRRPWPSQGDVDADRLYSAIGRALSEWERYDANLAFLFGNFLNPDEFHTGVRAYSAVRTFEGRCDMLQAASISYFHNLILLEGERSDFAEMQGDFKTILKMARCFCTRRNEITHAAVDYFMPEPPSSDDPTGRPVEYGLYPSYATTQNRGVTGVPTYCYTSVEIEYFREEFEKLKHPVVTLSGELFDLHRARSLRDKSRSLHPK